MGESAPPASIMGMVPVADEHRGVADGVGAAGAAGGEDVGWAAQVQRDGEFAGEIAVRAGGDGEEGGFAFGEEGAVLLFDEGEPPAAGAEGDADLALGFDVVGCRCRGRRMARASREAARASGTMRGTRRSSAGSMTVSGSKSRTWAATVDLRLVVSMLCEAGDAASTGDAGARRRLRRRCRWG